MRCGVLKDDLIVCVGAAFNAKALAAAAHAAVRFHPKVDGRYRLPRPGRIPERRGARKIDSLGLGRGFAHSRIVPNGNARAIYSFVLKAQPVAQERIEGALAEQRAILSGELARLKEILEA